MMPSWSELEERVCVLRSDLQKLGLILLAYPSSFLLEVILSLPRVASMLLLESECRRWTARKALC